MKSRVFCLFFACVIGMCSFQAAANKPELPKWIALADSSIPHYRLTKQVTCDEMVVSGRMKLATDFARATVTINDAIVLTVEPYCQLQVLDVTQWLRAGENAVAIDMACVNGPSAIAVEFELQLKSGQVVRLVSDATWAAVGGLSKAQSLGDVRAELWGAGRRDASLSPIENYEQWQLAKGSETQNIQPKFWTAPGFQISLLRTATADEGS